MIAYENRKSVEEQVDRVIRSRVAYLAAVLGVANLLALVGMWRAVISEAREAAISTATQEAKTQAQKAVDSVVKPTEEMFKASLNNATAMNQKFNDLYEQIGRTKGRAEGIDSELGKLQAQLDRLAKADYEHVDKLVTILKSLPADSRELVASLQVVRRLRVQYVSPPQHGSVRSPFLRCRFKAGPAGTHTPGRAPKGPTAPYNCFIPVGQEVQYVFQNSNWEPFVFGRRILDVWYVAEGTTGGGVPPQIDYLRAEPNPDAPNQIRFIVKANAPSDFYIQVFALYEDDPKFAELRGGQ